MQYNSNYKVWVSKDGFVYYLKDGKLKLKTDYDNHGYIRNGTAKGIKFQHRIVWETFVGEIPDGYEIDHINCVRNDNRLCNLRLLTRAENVHRANYKRVHSDESKKHMSEGAKKAWARRKSAS